MQQHAERPAYLPEHLQHTVDNVVVLGGYVGLASDGGNSWHDDSLLSYENGKFARYCATARSGMHCHPQKSCRRYASGSRAGYHQADGKSEVGRTHAGARPAGPLPCQALAFAASVLVE